VKNGISEQSSLDPKRGGGVMPRTTERGVQKVVEKRLVGGIERKESILSRSKLRSNKGYASIPCHRKGLKREGRKQRKDMKTLALEEGCRFGAYSP